MSAMNMNFSDFVELTDDEILFVSGGGDGGIVGDAIRAVGEVGQKIIETAYNAGYMLGKAIHDSPKASK